MSTQPASIEVFYSYEHKDEVLRNELEKHLSMLHRQGLISSWHDRQIVAGTDWAKDINTHLETASIILLLVSSDDSLFICRDGWYGYRPVVGGLEGSVQSSYITASPTEQYVVNINVNGQSITYTVNNTKHVSQTLNVQATNTFSSAISLDQNWRNDGAKV